MDPNKQYVKILLVGDESVGKTSIVIALASEESPLVVPPRAHDLYITGEITNQALPALIVDTCASEQSNEEIVKNILDCDVVCLVYSLDDSASISRVSSYWLPFLDELHKNTYKPIVIIGNKTDCVDCDIDGVDMFYIRENFPQVEGYFTVSALDLINLVEAFQFAQKTVLHPLRPLIDVKTKEVSEAFEKALKRIFKMFDDDFDGVVTWQEMLEFQKIVFKNVLYRQTLQELREAVRISVPDGLTSTGITFSGFLFIHKLFILRGMRDSIWKVLSTFGYNINLDFDENYLIPCFNIKSGEYVELTRLGIDFFKRIFIAYDKDKDGYLTQEDIAEIFIEFPACPISIEDYQIINDKYVLNLNNFISIFIRFTHISPDITLSALSILGFGKGLWYSNLNALQTSSPFSSFKNSRERTTYVCYVFGNYDSGKSSFLRKLFEKCNLEYKFFNQSYVLNINNHDDESFVIFEEVPWYRADDYAENRPFDLAIFVFDSSEPSSFNFCREMHNNFPHGVQSLFVGMKKDLGIVEQISDVDIQKFCFMVSKFPLNYFSVNDTSNELYTNFLTSIINFLVYGTLQRGSKLLKISLGILISVVAAASIGTVFFRKSLSV